MEKKAEWLASLLWPLQIKCFWLADMYFKKSHFLFELYIIYCVSSYSLLLNVTLIVGHSRTCPDRLTWLTGLWGSQPCTSISRPKAQTLWSRTTRSLSSGRPSTRTTALRTLSPAPQRESRRWELIVVFMNKCECCVSVCLDEVSDFFFTSIMKNGSKNKSAVFMFLLSILQLLYTETEAQPWW